SRPPRHHPDQAALSFTTLLRQDSGEGLSPPLEMTAPRCAGGAASRRSFRSVDTCQAFKAVRIGSRAGMIAARLSVPVRLAWAGGARSACPRVTVRHYYRLLDRACSGRD